MATNLLKRLDALLDDGLVRGKEPLGATGCVRGNWDYEIDNVPRTCPECKDYTECEFYCFNCLKHYCSEDCLDSHYAHD